MKVTGRVLNFLWIIFLNLVFIHNSRDFITAEYGVKIVEIPILNLFLLRKTEPIYFESEKSVTNEELLFKSNASPLNSNSDFVVPESEKLSEAKVLLKLVCTSTFNPVHISYVGQGAPIGLSTTQRMSSFYSEIYPLEDQNVTETGDSMTEINEILQNYSNNTVFKSTFIFEVLEKNTGNYSCCHYDNRENCESSYIFIPGGRKFLLNSHSNFHDSTFGIYSTSEDEASTGSQKTRLYQNFNFFENLESTYQLTINDDENKLLEFPCSTSWPTANAQLFLHDNHASSSLSPAETLLSSDFNPKFGFRLPLNLLQGKNDSNTTNFAEKIYICSFDEEGRVEQLRFKIQFQPGHNLTIKHDVKNSEFSCESSRDTELSFGLVPCHSVMDCQFTLNRLVNSIQPPMKRVTAGEEVKWRYNSDPLRCNTTKLGKLRDCQRPLPLGLFYCSIPFSSSTTFSTTEGVFAHTFYFNPYEAKKASLFTSMDDWQAIDYLQENIPFLTITRTKSLPRENLELGLNVTLHCIGKAILVSPSIIWIVQSSENLSLSLYQSTREWTDFQSGYIHGELTLETFLSSSSSFPSLKDLRFVYCAAPIVNSPGSWATSQNFLTLNEVLDAEDYDEIDIGRNAVGIGTAIGGLIGFNILVVLLYVVLAFLLLRKYSRIGPISLIVCMQFLLVLTLFLFSLCFPSDSKMEDDDRGEEIDS